jgi:hypothetical protein
MKIIEGLQTEYEAYVAINSQDDYSKAVVTYTERWASLMEDGITFTNLPPAEYIAQHADKDSHIADTEGITGFMYGAAVSALAHFWVYGEELRRWHNLDIQIGTEGERANESGGVLNPALMDLSLGED